MPGRSRQKCQEGDQPKESLVVGLTQVCLLGTSSDFNVCGFLCYKVLSYCYIPAPPGNPGLTSLRRESPAGSGGDQGHSQTALWNPRFWIRWGGGQGVSHYTDVLKSRRTQALIPKPAAWPAFLPPPEPPPLIQGFRVAGLGAGSEPLHLESGVMGALCLFAGSLASSLSPEAGPVGSGLQRSTSAACPPTPGLASEGLCCFGFPGCRLGMWHHPGITVQNRIPGSTRPLGDELSLRPEAHRQGNEPSWRQAPGACPWRAAWNHGGSIGDRSPLCLFLTPWPRASVSSLAHGLLCKAVEIHVQKALRGPRCGLANTGAACVLTCSLRAGTWRSLCSYCSSPSGKQ